MPSFYFERGKQSLHCETSGNKNYARNIIFLHGLASNATRWRELMNATELKYDTNLLAMNLRGHGHSTSFSRFTRQHWCDDLRHLDKQLNGPVILIGHSMGAQIALEYASQYPQNLTGPNLSGLVLIDPVFPQALTGLLAKVARFRWLVSIAAKLTRFFYWLGLHKRHYPYRDLQKLDEETRAVLAANPDKNIADLYMNPFSDLKFIPLANYLQDLFEVTRKLPELNSITTPVLVLLSSGASTSHVEKNKTILDQLPNLEIETIHADHWLLTEKPEEARQVIERWCQKIFSQAENLSNDHSHQK